MEINEKISQGISKIDSMVSAFECSYLWLLESSEGEKEERNRAVWLFYAIKDLVDEIMSENKN